MSQKRMAVIEIRRYRGKSGLGEFPTTSSSSFEFEFELARTFVL